MRPIHPGEILKQEYLLPFGMRVHTLAIELKIPPSRIHQVMLERRGITADMALRLARFFNTSAQFWLNLQTSFDLKQAEIEMGDKIEHEIKPIITPHHQHAITV